MKKLLMLIILPVFLVSCNETGNMYGINQGDKVKLTIDCTYWESGRDNFMKASDKIYNVLKTNSQSIVIGLDNGKTFRADGKCFTKIEKPAEKVENSTRPTEKEVEKRKNVIENNPEIWKQEFEKPATSKYEIVKEYIEFEKLCKSYGKLFRKDFVTEITEKDELNCDGKNQKQIEYDIELINRFRGK